MLNRQIILGVGMLAFAAFNPASSSGWHCNNVDEPSYNEQKCEQQLIEMEIEGQKGNSSPPNAPYVENPDTIAQAAPKLQMIS